MIRCHFGCVVTREVWVVLGCVLEEDGRMLSYGIKKHFT